MILTWKGLTVDTELVSGRSLLTKDCANTIAKSVRFAIDLSKRLYFYKDGIYHLGGEDIVRQLHRELLNTWDYGGRWKSKMGYEVVDWVAMDAVPIWERPPMHQINLLNGIYNWETEQLEPHSPDWCSTVQIPIKYDPDATCPVWDTFLRDIFPEGVTLLKEIIGLCMIPFTGLQKCIILVGEGSNGKSKYLDGLQAAIGVKNVSHKGLHELCIDRFSRAALVGKLVNVFADLPSEKIKDASNFKAITGEDTITVEYKHKDSYSYATFCKLIFSCNEIIESDDKSEGYRRRFMNIPFVRKFPVDSGLGDRLKIALASPRELSGLLNSILPRMSSIVEDGFTTTEEIAAIISNYSSIPENVVEYFNRDLIADTEAFVPMSNLYGRYCTKDGCRGRPGNKPFTRDKLVSFLRTYYPEVKANVLKKYKGKVLRCYIGIRMRDKEVHDELLTQAWEYSGQADPLN